MWWGIWAAVTIIGFALTKIESLFLIGFILRYIGVAALIILAINWLNSTNRGKK